MNTNRPNYLAFKEEAKNQRRSVSSILEDYKYNSAAKTECFNLLSKSKNDFDIESLNNCYDKISETLEIRENIMNQIFHGKF